MSQSISWGNLASVSGWVSELRKPPGGRAISAPTQESVVSFDSMPPASDTVPPKKITRVSPTRPEPPRFSAEMRIEERLELLVTWAEEAFSTREVFVTDESGLLIAGLVLDTTHVAASALLLRPMAQLVDIMSDFTGRMSVSTRDGRILSLSRVPSQFGFVAIGIITNEVVEDHHLVDAQSTLESAMGENQ